MRHKLTPAAGALAAAGMFLAGYAGNPALAVVVLLVATSGILYTALEK